MISGYIKIKYQDSMGNMCYTYQEFRFFTRYDEEEPNVTVTFGDLIKPENLSKTNFLFNL